MQRRTLDRLTSYVGLTLTVILIVAGSILAWGNNFVTDQVRTQLAAQQIFFPAEGSPATKGAAFAPMREYAGQQLTTGAQAETYANSFIAPHLTGIGGGKTYAQLSAQAQANPTDTKLAATVNTMFRGETLRGLLLNAYAFGTMATLAGIAAILTFVGAGVMLLLSLLGLLHSRKTSVTQEVFAGRVGRTPAPVG